VIGNLANQRINEQLDDVELDAASRAHQRRMAERDRLGSRWATAGSSSLSRHRSRHAATSAAMISTSSSPTSSASTAIISSPCPERDRRASGTLLLARKAAAYGVAGQRDSPYIRNVPSRY
jgi:hypothetical protein